MYYLAMLNSSDSTGTTSTSVGRELSAKLIERAGNAARDGRTAQMDADLAAARRLGADPSALAEVQALASARTKSASITPRPTPSQPNKLKRLKYAPPEYPQKAFQQKLTGSVTVEFTVDVNGEPRDTRVVDADPPEVFDKAALAAVKKWRYEPVVVNNVPTEVPTRMVIRFELPK
jgi:protein TonB